MRRDLRDFAPEMINVIPALVVIERDDGGAAAKPAERLAKRDVKINREVARGAVVLRQSSRRGRPTKSRR